MAYPKELVNLDRYPLDRLGSQAYRDLVQRGGGKLQADGILCLDGFLSETGSVVLMEEAQSIEGLAYLQESDHTVYFADPDIAVPESHPRRRKVKTRKRSVARHLISGNGAMNALYEWPALRALVAELLGLETLYLHADPSNALVLNVYGREESLGWHSDHAHFAVNLLLRATDGGGEFEYVTDVRSGEAENYGRVEQVLDGVDSSLQQASVDEGTLVIFKGRNSLHRVRPVTGAVARYLLIMHYEESPGVRISREYRRLIFGPDAPSD